MRVFLFLAGLLLAPLLLPATVQAQTPPAASPGHSAAR